MKSLNYFTFLLFIFGWVFNVSANEDIDSQIAKETTNLFKSNDGLNLDYSKEKKLVSLQLQRALSSGLLGLEVIGNFGDDPATFADEDGLTNDVTLKMSFNKLFYDGARSNVEHLLDIAEIAFIRAKELSILKQALNKCIFSVLGKKSKWSELKGNDKDRVEKNCNSEIEAVENYTDDTQDIEFYRSYWFLKNTATYSPGEFKYYDLTTQTSEKSDTEKLGWDIEFGRFELAGDSQNSFWRAQRYSLTLGYSKGNKSQESSKSNICKPIQAEGFQECFNTYLKPTYENETLSISGNYAFRFNLDNLVKGVEVTLKHVKAKKSYSDPTKNKDTSRWSLNLPIILFLNKEFDIKAGLEFDWKEHLDSDDDSFDPITIGLFVSKGFDLTDI